MRALCSGASAPVTISIPCEIKYELDGGTNHADNPASYTVESGAITLKNPGIASAAGMKPPISAATP